MFKCRFCKNYYFSNRKDIPYWSKNQICNECKSIIQKEIEAYLNKDKEAK